jgi:hypothetical protein
MPLRTTSYFSDVLDCKLFRAISGRRFVVAALGSVRGLFLKIISAKKDAV